MPGLVPGIHVFLPGLNKGVDGRDKPGHNAAVGCQSSLQIRKTPPILQTIFHSSAITGYPPRDICSVKPDAFATCNCKVVITMSLLTNNPIHLFRWQNLRPRILQGLPNALSGRGIEGIRRIS